MSSRPSAPNQAAALAAVLALVRMLIGFMEELEGTLAGLPQDHPERWSYAVAMVEMRRLETKLLADIAACAAMSVPGRARARRRVSAGLAGAAMRDGSPKGVVRTGAALRSPGEARAPPVGRRIGRQ